MALLNALTSAERRLDFLAGLSRWPKALRRTTALLRVNSSALDDAADPKKTPDHAPRTLGAATFQSLRCFFAGGVDVIAMGYSVSCLRPF